MAGRWAVPEEPGITQRGTCRFSIVCRSASEIEVSDIVLFCFVFWQPSLGQRGCPFAYLVSTPTILQPSPTQPGARLEDL